MIIGGGFAGCLLAYTLGDFGLRIMLVETGSDRKIGDWRNGRWFEKERDDVLVESDLPYNISYSRVKALGGSTEAWEGYCYRMEEHDLRMNSAFGAGVDWPIDIETLATHYDRVERLLGVAGNYHELQGFKNASYPLPAFPFENYEKRIVNGCKPLGIKFIHVPQARNSLPYDHRSSCLGIGTCNCCPTGARWSPSVSLVPRLKGMPNVTMATEHTCIHLDTFGKRLIKQAILVDNRTGSKKQVHAKGYVLTGGTIEVCRLLLASKTADYSEGIGNKNGLVGRNFMDHPILRVRADTKWRKNSRKRQTNILASSHDFRRFDKKENAPGFLLNINSRIAPPKILVAAHMEMLPHMDNRIMMSRTRDRFGLPMPLLRISSKRGLQQGTVEKARRILELVACQAGGHNLIFDPLQLWACHLMGGCRMGKDPETSTVDSHLRCHQMENMYILSCAVFPTSGSVNPTLTLGALTVRLAEYLKASL
jgi:choline dehydrogenase-like flavoprotein